MKEKMKPNEEDALLWKNADDIETDPYLQQLRKKEAEKNDQEEKLFEQKRKTRQTDDAAALERIKMQTLNAMNEEVVVPEEVSPRENRVIYTKEGGMTKKGRSFTRRIRDGVLGALALFGSVAGAKGAETLGPVAEDSLKNKDVKERPLSDSVGKTIKTETKNVSQFSEASKEKLFIREVSSQERKDWNAFLSFVKAQGYEGSKELDKKSDKLARSLFSQYKKLHPETTVDYTIVASVQADMHKLRENVRAFAKRRNDPRAEDLMNNISDIDGWFGSQTSRYGYPEMFFQEYNNNTLVNSEKLGVVDSEMNPEKNATKQIKKKIPPNVKIEHLADGDYYEDPDTGDLVRVR